ncbi:rhodanese-like domain-containing protein [Helicobacter muridarum]|uniref:Rhodanese-like domain-containing protein n=1 Tax=Helicobacter muridarum TaxID=216 RepID=A0A099U0J4_9HELI|nr:rhodanese-like domain-containing protein [Helicobacter muridarum]TLE01180.1 rhodanese-like domain-containing protein [Helicobacter muridarum]STQ86056.1 rhodanese-like domain-containing protein [Helicobacter muridarum]
MEQYGTNFKSLAKAVYIDEMNLEDFIIVDVRDEEEVNTARIKGVPNITEPHAIHNLAKDNPDKKILLHCKMGLRAARMGNILVGMGCNNIYFFDDVFSRFYQKFEIVGNNKDSLVRLEY